MPMALLEAYLDMLPRLGAEESIDGAARAAAGQGGESASRLLRAWRQQASGGSAGAGARAASPSDLSRMGISLTVVAAGGAA